MKSYKDFKKINIGSSDISSLILVGPKKGESLALREMNFGEDGDYEAYLVDEEEVEIGDHYSLVESFDYWLRIYDDTSKTFDAYAKEIRVYRAAGYGCIIHVIGVKEVLYL